MTTQRSIVNTGLALVIGVIVAVIVADVVEEEGDTFGGLGGTVVDYIVPIFVLALLAMAARRLM